MQLCAGAPGGAPCPSDTGAGLVAGGAVLAVLPGGSACVAGRPQVLGDLSAGELGAFVAGDDAPPEAPRGPAPGTGGLRGLPVLGSTLTCDPGTWTGAPAFSYDLFDAATGAVLQSGPQSARVLGPADLGRSIACRVTATSPGGHAAAVTAGTSAVLLTALATPGTAASPAPAATGPAATLAVLAPRRVRPGADVRIRVRLRAGATPLGRTALCLQAAAGTVRRSPGTTRVGPRRRCLAVAGLAAGATRTLTLVLRAPARPGRFALTASAAPAGLTAFTRTASVRVRRVAATSG